MTETPETGTSSVGIGTGDVVSDNSVLTGKFTPLESQLELVPSVADRITRKHWPQAEREQYPFWIGILVLALLGIAGMVLSSMQIMTRIALIIAILMVIGIVPLVVSYLRSLQGRFKRQWELFAGDGELFRFFRDAGFVLGHHMPIGRPDEKFTLLLPVSFPEAVRAAENWLRYSAFPDPLPPDVPPGLYVPPLSMKEPAGSETHRVYEAEYRGFTTRALSIRVDSADAGSDITVGFTLRSATAESRERLSESLTGRLTDRLIAASVLGSIREACGLEPEPIPASETEYPLGKTASPQAN